VVLLRLKVARRLQTALVSCGCVAFAAGVGLLVGALTGVAEGVGAGLIAAGPLAVVYGLLLVDDGTAG
jgi:hypothetical protein